VDVGETIVPEVDVGDSVGVGDGEGEGVGDLPGVGDAAGEGVAGLVEVGDGAGEGDGARVGDGVVPVVNVGVIPVVGTALVLVGAGWCVGVGVEGSENRACTPGKSSTSDTMISANAPSSNQGRSLGERVCG